jgi:ATPase subunit of ABC transporter with duplicated ATPase domains
LDLKGRDKLVIYGKNGVGKTSFLKALRKVLGKKGIKYGYIPQDYGDVLDYKQDVVSYLEREQDKYPIYRIRQILGQLGFKREDMLKPIGEISEGQKLKVLLLRLVSLDSEVLLLDEPTRNISPLNQDEIYGLFSSYQGAILAVTHDRTFIESVFDDMLELTETGFKVNE